MLFFFQMKKKKKHIFTFLQNVGFGLPPILHLHFGKVNTYDTSQMKQKNTV